MGKFRNDYLVLFGQTQVGSIFHIILQPINAGIFGGLRWFALDAVTLPETVFWHK